MTLLYDALHAYLTPLLTKHASGKALVYDDLISSWDSAQDVLKLNNKNGANRIVSKRLEELHNSQLRAYQEAAQKALRDYSQQCQLLDDATPLGDGDDEDVDKVLLSVERPAWHVDETVWQERFLEPLKERLMAQKKKNESMENNNGHVLTVTSDDAEDHDDDDDDDGHDESGGEEAEEMDEVVVEEEQQDEEATEMATKPIPKKKKTNKKKVTVAKTKVVRKAGATTKQLASAGALGAGRNARGRKRVQRGGRGGRGGGGGGK